MRTVFTRLTASRPWPAMLNLNGEVTMEIEAVLSESELLQIVAEGTGNNIAEETIDELGRELATKVVPARGRPKGIRRSNAASDSPTYWRAVRREVHTLVCTQDKKYSDLRKQIERLGAKSQTALVSTIAAAVASYIGVAAGILVPMCALVLLAILRVGKNAFCAQAELNIPIMKRS